jgi:hypothetical protein
MEILNRKSPQGRDYYEYSLLGKNSRRNDDEEMR